MQVKGQVKGQAGVEITKISDLSFGKVPKKSTCPTSFRLVHPKNCVLLIIILLGLSCFRQIGTFPSDNHPYSFTCSTPFLPVPDRRTVYNFHPCQVRQMIKDFKSLGRAVFQSQLKLCLQARPQPELGAHELQLSMCFYRGILVIVNFPLLFIYHGREVSRSHPKSLIGYRSNT